jgi:hypothetical protein
VKQLAIEKQDIKFVLIPSRSVTPNWPESNWPMTFVYKSGTREHELVRLPAFITEQQLCDNIRELSVFDDKTLDDKSEGDDCDGVD